MRVDTCGWISPFTPQRGAAGWRCSAERAGLPVLGLGCSAAPGLRRQAAQSDSHGQCLEAFRVLPPHMFLLQERGLQGPSAPAQWCPPLLQVFVRKLRKAYGKSEWNTAERLKDNKPNYKLDHIVKER